MFEGDEFLDFFMKVNEVIVEDDEEMMEEDEEKETKLSVDSSL